VGSPPDRRRAFQSIYELHYRHVAAYARRRAAPGDVDDVVAETFLVAWRRLEVIPTGELALAWLYGVARRVISQRQRSGRRRDRLVARLGGLRADDEDTAVISETLDDRERVRAALALLRDPDQEILRLSKWEGLSATELSVVLGCSPNAATIRLHRAHKRFAKALRIVDGKAQEELAEEEAPT